MNTSFENDNDNHALTSEASALQVTPFVNFKFCPRLLIGERHRVGRSIWGDGEKHRFGSV